MISQPSVGRAARLGRWSAGLASLGLVLATGRGCSTATSAEPPSLRSECEAPRAEWIWCDDFEVDRTASYFEYDRAGGRFVRASGVGEGGGWGMRAQWSQAGQVQAGSLHLAFGRTPTAYMRPIDGGGRDYREIYWRLYLRNDPDWTGGGGNKLSRAQVLATSNWAQAMIAPVWSGSAGSARDRLMIDPFSGTDPAGTLATTQYGDAALRPLGAVQGPTAIFAAPELGRWHCVEAQVRLNDAGQANGEFRLWIDGRLEASRADLNWVGSYAAYGINTVFVENYWNAGSPKPQARYLDRLVVSTARIGCSAG